METMIIYLVLGCVVIIAFFNFISSLIKMIARIFPFFLATITILLILAVTVPRNGRTTTAGTVAAPGEEATELPSAPNERQEPDYRLRLVNDGRASEPEEVGDAATQNQREEESAQDIVNRLFPTDANRYERTVDEASFEGGKVRDVDAKGKGRRY